MSARDCPHTTRRQCTKPLAFHIALATLSFILAGNALPAEHLSAAETIRPGGVRAEQRFTHPTHRWSVTYPNGWNVDARRPELVRIVSPPDKALCTVHSGKLSPELFFRTADEFADSMLANDERFFRGRGQSFHAMPRRPLTLPGGQTGSDVLVEIGGTGKSRRAYVLVPHIRPGLRGLCQRLAQAGPAIRTHPEVLHGTEIVDSMAELGELLFVPRNGSSRARRHTSSSGDISL